MAASEIRIFISIKASTVEFIFISIMFWFLWENLSSNLKHWKYFPIKLFKLVLVFGTSTRRIVLNKHCIISENCWKILYSVQKTLFVKVILYIIRNVLSIVLLSCLNAPGTSRPHLKTTRSNLYLLLRIVLLLWLIPLRQYCTFQFV